MTDLSAQIFNRIAYLENILRKNQISFDIGEKIP